MWLGRISFCRLSQGICSLKKVSLSSQLGCMLLKPYIGLQDEEHNSLRGKWWFRLTLIIKVVLDGLVTGWGIIQKYPCCIPWEVRLLHWLWKIIIIIIVLPTCTIIVWTNHQTSIELNQLVLAHVQQKENNNKQFLINFINNMVKWFSWILHRGLWWQKKKEEKEHKT